MQFAPIHGSVETIGVCQALTPPATALGLGLKAFQGFQGLRVQGSRVLGILRDWGLGLKGFKGLGFRFGVWG